MQRCPMISYIALGVSVVALAGVAYILFFALPKVGKGMEGLGAGLAEMGDRLRQFASFMASKL